MTAQASIVLRDEDFREIFTLFTSPTDEERKEVYNESSRFYFRTEDLAEEYSLTQDKKEFAVDAWRAVTYFLHRHGYVLVRDGTLYDLGQSSGYSANEGQLKP